MASQCCSWVTTSQSSWTRSLSKNKDAYVDNVLTLMGMESCNPRTEDVAETNPSNVVPLDVDSLHRKGGKRKKGKGKGKNKGDRPRHDGKGKGEQSVKLRHFDGYCNQCGEYGHKKPDCAGKNKFFNGTCKKVWSTWAQES